MTQFVVAYAVKESSSVELFQTLGLSFTPFCVVVEHYHKGKQNIRDEWNELKRLLQA